MSNPLTIEEVALNIHAIEADLGNSRREYGILTKTCYKAYSAGEEPAEDARVLDRSDWAGAYEIWLQRRE